MLTSQDIQAFISLHKLDAKLIELAQSAPTVPDAAKAMNVETSQILKSLVFLAQDQPVLVVAAGEARISQKLLAAAVGTSRSKLKFAKPEQALAITGFEVGAMPPFGHKERLMTLIDQESVTQTLNYGGGGTKSSLVEISLETLKRVTQAQFVPLTERT